MSEPVIDGAVDLRLLGAPALLLGGRTLAFAPERPYLLLALLACRRDWVRRDELADLLYPGRGLESARSNLRKVLFLARKLDGVGTIEQRGDLLHWAPPSDLERFDRACDERRWADALAAHGGELLLGLDAAWPEGATEWLDAERRRVQARWHEACTRRLAELAGEPAAARELAEAMLRHDPLDDVALQALGRAQQALGEADAALRAIAGYAGRLQAIGVEPSAAVAQLQRDLRGVAPPPLAPVGLVGRRHELAQLHERLAGPDCRVLTLLGPPGIGKSALARAAAAELRGAWVPLEDLEQPEQVPERIARCLQLATDGRAPPWEALAAALAPRQALLVLDNAEHLALAAGLQRVLDAAPGVRVLAASRTPLGLAQEWRLPLEGLPLPDADEADPDVLRANDAVRLFELRARPLAPGFDLAAEASDVVRLVHEVEGLPLAIELLAAWRRLMPVREILAELAASLDVLEASAPGERSVRASFGRAWQQLGPAEQRLLAQLALLPGPVSRELVRQVLQAPLPALAVLVDRSLLRAEGDGGFALHPLIRRLAAPLAADADAVRERHARHVARMLAHGSRAAVEDLPHLRAAWAWALARAEAPLLDALRAPYAGLLVRRTLWREGIQAMRDLAALLRRQLADASPRQAAALQRMLAQALQSHAACAYQCGELDQALDAAREAEVIATRQRDAMVQSAAASRIGAVCWQRGDLAAAREAFTRSATLLAEGAPDAQDKRASAAAWLALVDKAEGRFDAALAGYETAVRLLREVNALPAHLYLMNNLGNLLRLMRRAADALRVLHEGLQLARQHGNLEDEPFLLTNIALVHEGEGEAEAARPWADRAVASAIAHGEPMIEAAARLARARCTAALQREAGPAMPDVHAALEICLRLQAPPQVASAMAGAGIVLALGGRPEPGLAIVRWALAQPGCTTDNRADVQHLLRVLRLDAPAPTAAPLAPDAPFNAALALLHRTAGA